MNQQSLILSEKMLTPEELAGVLSIDVKTLCNWRWIGKGPKFVKIGRNVRYKQSDVLIYINTRTRKSTSDMGNIEHE